MHYLQNIRTSLILLLLMYSSSALAQNTAPWVGTTLNDLPCQGKGQGVGPYDYRDSFARKNKIPIVEQYHFNRNVEFLLKPMAGNFAGDFDYTLRAVPNHHRALLSLARYQIQLNHKIKKTQRPLSPVECYFQRAIIFQPKDYALYSLYGFYLRKIGHLKQAKELYQKALKLSPNTSKLEYSYSLLLIETKEYEEALNLAKKAYQHGKPPNALKNKLKRLGIWK